MFNIFKSYRIYKQILHEHCESRDKDGFAYLNSEKCSKLFEKIKTTEKQLIEFSGFKKNDLLRVSTSFDECHDSRENAFLQNINNYSKTYTFKQGIFLLGYAHRTAIIKKILDNSAIEESNVNWNFYGSV